MGNTITALFSLLDPNPARMAIREMYPVDLARYVFNPFDVIGKAPAWTPRANCRNCGAPPNFTAKCEYCGSVSKS